MNHAVEQDSDKAVEDSWDESPVDVVIVGAGFGGLGMGTALARGGKKSFVILERAEEVGGTWWYNSYPGAACDVPSHLYSFSFRPNANWSRMFASQPEILDYLRQTAREEGLLPHIRFGTELLDARWDVTGHIWRVKTSRGTFSARTLVTAVGHLSEPRMPAIAGIASFNGTLFHSAQWDHGVDLSGKRIGVIGSGATAIQVVPELAKISDRLVVFQRSAPYITPRPDRAYTPAEQGMFRRLPETMEAERADMFWANEERYAQRRGTESLVSAAAHVAINHLHNQVKDPELVRKLTPGYTFGCKRVLKSDEYYPTFNRANVTLETDGIQGVTENAVITTTGTVHELDALIVCTGFEATDLPISYKVYGRSGQSLSERWSRGMQAFSTSAVPDFPNMWIINGPNTGLGHNSAVYIAESQIAYIAGAIDHMDVTGTRVMEVSDEAEGQYMLELEDLAKGTVWLNGGCKSWYVDHRNGRLTTLWPDYAYSFRQHNGTFDPAPYAEASESASEGYSVKG
jgi:cation diffusion facilitator CzcD-associated flavoprotein CzcO